MKQICFPDNYPPKHPAEGITDEELNNIAEGIEIRLCNYWYANITNKEITEQIEKRLQLLKEFKDNLKFQIENPKAKTAQEVFDYIAQKMLYMGWTKPTLPLNDEGFDKQGNFQAWPLDLRLLADGWNLTWNPVSLQSTIISKLTEIFYHKESKIWPRLLKLVAQSHGLSEAVVDKCNMVTT
ncbi:MAG: hypothetical protein KGO96_07065 [Elusimicrobia bacterium]|nr:hypothetical protein [Elusimicrobiota bacterium]